MPSATLEDIALRSTNPVKRAMDVICVVMLQLLMLLVVANEPDPDKRRNHPALSADTILARLEAGETFNLPLLLISCLRSAAQQLRPNLRLDEPSIEQAAAPIPTPPQAPGSTPKAPRKATSQRRFAPETRQVRPKPRRAATRGLKKESADPVQGRTTPISLRYRN
jgi:hypothetical protein